jgi:hypothetical protein
MFNLFKSKRPKTVDISNLNFQLFEKYGWKLLERVTNLKEFAVEEYREDNGLIPDGSGGYMVVQPYLFEKYIDKYDFYIKCEFDNELYLILDYDYCSEYIRIKMSDITEEKLINFETVVRRDYDYWTKRYKDNKDENEKIQHLKQKPISELTVEEFSLLKERNII